MSEKLISVKDLNESTGLPVSWWYAQTAAGTVPHIKIGKYVRFRESEVLAWLDQHRAGPAVEVRAAQ
jgi:excisionase family DNA binding protein